jgi:pyrroline-5-carboxylate reductase
MFEAKIGFIGGGNMARSIVSGIVSNGYNPINIWVVDPDEIKLDQYREMGINAETDVHKVIEKVDILLLAVKPQVMSELSQAIGAKVKSRNILLISIVTGIRLKQLESWYGEKTAIVRVMPNTPSLLKCGASGMYHNANVAKQQKELAEHLMRSVGVVSWLKDESLIDVVGAISGSGPAYYFLMMEVIQEIGVSMGLTEKQAKLLTTQTAYGAARMALETTDDLEVLRQNVTSKGGITEVSIQTLEEKNFRGIMKEALNNNLKHSEVLAESCVKSAQISHKDEEGT